MSAPVDADIRKRALDAQASFIVQAPAGSGKTELLTRRVLTLLATVDEPEEILAITFTRKAASEMRQRVVETLERALGGKDATNEYEADGLALAAAVLDRDRQLDWQLIKNPQRLNLRTIDALATQLAHRLPVTSALGAPTGVVDDASVIYEEVAGRFIEGNLHLLDRVLLQVGNRLAQAQDLLANLLANRDQWKRHVYAAGDDHDELRLILEQMLAELIESRLANVRALMPAELHTQLPVRLRKAFGYLLEDLEGDIDALPFDMQSWQDFEEMPGDSLEDLYGWYSVGEALLTAGGARSVRKAVTKKTGFPAKGDAKKRGVTAAELESHKQEMLDVLEVVRESPEFVEALIEVCSLPYPQYKDEQWDLLSQLLSVLPLLLLELQFVFAERGVVDFGELSERAQRALGTADEPTDLALAMDLSLSHVLVDEFQDTSQTQFRLFAQLVAGWSTGDGRTFFAVGDPMQSIYRFRDGDVALFGQAQQHGIGPVSLESLTLTVNFRAAPPVIDWVNDSFSSIFPTRSDPDSGAVVYSASVAHLETDGRVQLHPLLDKEKIDEAELVAVLAEKAIAGDVNHQVAILVRTRGQAAEIFDALRNRSLAFQSVDMDRVGERPVVRDLLSLCLALRYPHDRLHWLSLLRAPFVGLTLKDLHALMNESGSHTATIELLRQPDRLATLSKDGQARLARVMAVIEPALSRVSRDSLMPWVEAVWLKLGGPAVCRDAVDRDAAERALARLQLLEADGRLWQSSVMNDAMKSLYAATADDADCQIQIMTLHKAKGLEFDTVILPALDRQPRGDTSQLLNWFESTLDGQARLLLAPLEQSGLQYGQRDRINRLVRKARERCNKQENLRLLYVACTRAKHQLHLIARSGHTSTGQLKTPIADSLLSPLWPLIKPTFEALSESQDTHAQATSTTDTHVPQTGSTTDTHVQMSLDMGAADESAPKLERLSKNIDFPQFSTYRWQDSTQIPPKEEKSLEFSWAGRKARDIGTVVHQQFQILAEQPDQLATLDLARVAAIARRQLSNMGVPKEMLALACDTVVQAVTNIAEDVRGQWVLAEHELARSEWALTVPADMGVLYREPDSAVSTQPGLKFVGVQKVVIDRTFVDEEGIRWVVDFKTGDHQGGQLEGFLDNEQARYADQLNRYADIIRLIDDRPIRAGLYFPLLKAWREWEPPIRP